MMKTQTSEFKWRSSSSLCNYFSINHLIYMYTVYLWICIYMTCFSIQGFNKSNSSTIIKNKISGTQQLQNVCWFDSLHHGIKSNESDCCPQPSITVHNGHCHCTCWINVMLSPFRRIRPAIYKLQFNDIPKVHRNNKI